MAPEPMPRTKRPSVSALTVPALMARLKGVRRATGETEMPVESPPGTAGRVAVQRCRHIWKES